MKVGVLEELLREAEELLKTGDTKRAMDVLLTAWAYRESGMLMAPEEALDYLRVRFPESGELASIERGENISIVARRIYEMLGMKSLPSAEL